MKKPIRERQVIALRLDDKTIRELEALAKSETRSLSNLAEILVKRGLIEHKNSKGK